MYFTENNWLCFASHSSEPRHRPSSYNSTLPYALSPTQVSVRLHSLSHDPFEGQCFKSSSSTDPKLFQTFPTLSVAELQYRFMPFMRDVLQCLADSIRSERIPRCVLIGGGDEQLQKEKASK